MISPSTAVFISTIWTNFCVAWCISDKVNEGISLSQQIERSKHKKVMKKTDDSQSISSMLTDRFGEIRKFCFGCSAENHLGDCVYDRYTSPRMHEFFRSRDQWRPFAHILTRAVFKVLGKSYFEFKLLRIDTIQSYANCIQLHWIAYFELKQRVATTSTLHNSRMEKINHGNGQ